MFQHTATRRWLPNETGKDLMLIGFNTQPPEGGCEPIGDNWQTVIYVSTHSHPKVAAHSELI